MSKRNKSLFSNALKAQCDIDEAAKMAEEKLKSKWPTYPTDYDLIRQYRDEHAALVQEFLHPPKAIASPVPPKEPTKYRNWHD